MFYGYAREGAGSESLEAQTDALKAAGAAHVFKETDSVKRPQLALTLQAAGFGDVILVTRLDRLAQTAADLCAVYRKAADRGTGIQSLTESITDPATPEGRFFPLFVEWFAAFDAATLAARLTDGRHRARARGVSFGKPPILDRKKMERAFELYEIEGKTMAEIAFLLRVSHPTISRVIAKMRREKQNN